MADRAAARVYNAESGVTCPACGKVDHDAWEWVGRTHDGYRINCGSCGALWELSNVVFSVDFTVAIVEAG